MPDAATSIDALQWHLSGATSHLGAQTSPAASIGNYCSSTELQMLAWQVSGAIDGLTVERITGANGTGTATLYAITTSSLVWTPPSGTGGTAITIAAGETKVIAGYTEPSKAVRVTRASDSPDLTGTATYTLTDAIATCVGMSDVTSGQAAAGDVTQRGFFLRNASSTPVYNVVLWIDPAATWLALAEETPSDTEDGYIEASTNEHDIPAGLTWKDGTSATHADALYIGTINAGEMTGIRLRRTVPAITANSALTTNVIGLQFDSAT